VSALQRDRYDRARLGVVERILVYVPGVPLRVVRPAGGAPGARGM